MEKYSLSKSLRITVLLTCTLMVVFYYYHFFIIIFFNSITKCFICVVSWTGSTA